MFEGMNIHNVRFKGRHRILSLHFYFDSFWSAYFAVKKPRATAKKTRGLAPPGPKEFPQDPFPAADLRKISGMLVIPQGTRKPEGVVSLIDICSWDWRKKRRMVELWSRLVSTQGQGGGTVFCGCFCLFIPLLCKKNKTPDQSTTMYGRGRILTKPLPEEPFSVWEALQHVTSSVTQMLRDLWWNFGCGSSQPGACRTLAGNDEIGVS